MATQTAVSVAGGGTAALWARQRGLRGVWKKVPQATALALRGLLPEPFLNGSYAAETREGWCI